MIYCIGCVNSNIYEAGHEWLECRCKVRRDVDGKPLVTGLTQKDCDFYIDKEECKDDTSRD